MTSEEIIEFITSKDTHKVWKSACAIIDIGQNYEKIKPLIKYLPLIKEKTTDLKMGGGFAPNQRFIDFAIKTLEFHKDRNECPCKLYTEKYKLTNDVVDRKIQYEGFNPNNEVEKGNIKILETTRIEGKWIDFYFVECMKCKADFKVEEREGHYKFWNWKKTD
jgi:hypothetical protein